MDESNDAAPAAMKNFTQRIGFVLLSGEADNERPHIQNSPPDDATKCLSAT